MLIFAVTFLSFLSCDMSGDFYVFYDDNGATSGEIPETKKYYDWETFTIAGQGNLKRGNLSFEGWLANTEDGIKLYKPGDRLTISADLYLYAKWKDNPDNSPFSYTVADGKATITSYFGSERRPFIPATFGDKPVVAIGDSAFNRTDYTNLILPESIQSVGTAAFDSMITTITIAANVAIADDTSFGDYGAEFRTYYRDNGMKGGVYLYTGGAWDGPYRED